MPTCTLYQTGHPSFVDSCTVNNQVTVTEAYFVQILCLVIVHRSVDSSDVGRWRWWRLLMLYHVIVIRRRRERSVIVVHRVDIRNGTNFSCRWIRHWTFVTGINDRGRGLPGGIRTRPCLAKGIVISDPTWCPLYRRVCRSRNWWIRI